MKAQYDQTLLSSFYLWFEKQLIKDDVKAYTTNLENTFKYVDYPDLPPNFIGYQGQFRQLVADSSIENPNTGIFIDGDFVTADSSQNGSVFIDYNNGRVIVPNSSYGEIIEEVLTPVLEEMYQDRLKETGKTGADAWLGFGSIHLVWELGKRIGTPDSLIYWAYKHQIPIVIPGITDGSIGAQLFMLRQKHRDFHIDTLADEQVMSDMTWDVDVSNALMVGGGISKHHVIWWNQYRGGLDAAVYITTAPEHDGSLSGARLREAISWGKMRPEAPNVCVEGDASVLLPLLGSDLFQGGDEQ